MSGIVPAYTQLWGVVKLPSVLRLSVILVSMRLSFLCAESVATLKLIEKGVAKVWPRLPRHRVALQGSESRSAGCGRGRGVLARKVQAACTVACEAQKPLIACMRCRRRWRRWCCSSFRASCCRRW
jgi:hypothetical protein